MIMAEQENVPHSNVLWYRTAWDTVFMSSYVAAHKVTDRVLDGTETDRYNINELCYSTVTVMLLTSSVA